MVDTLHPPTEVIASFPKPNFVNPETHGPGLIILTLLLTVIGITTVITRLYARFYVTKAPGIDDALIVAALVFGVALSILNIVGNQIYYNGYHIWDIPPASYVPHRINVWLAQLCFTLALCCVKISVLLFYRRLSVSFTDKFLIAVWVGIVYNILYASGFTLTLCLLYRPLPAYWLSFDPTWVVTHGYQGGSEWVAEPLSAALSSIGDLYSALLPMILISRLQMPRKQKNALYCLFSLAFLVVITGLVRIVYMYRMVNVTYDFTWTLWKVWVLCQAELWTALFAASAPALKPLVKRYAFHISSSVTTSRNLRLQELGRSSQRMGGGHGRPELSTDRYIEISRDEKNTGNVASSRVQSVTHYSATLESVSGSELNLTEGSRASGAWVPSHVRSASGNV